MIKGVTRNSCFRLEKLELQVLLNPEKVWYVSSCLRLEVHSLVVSFFYLLGGFSKRRQVSVTYQNNFPKRQGLSRIFSLRGRTLFFSFSFPLSSSSSGFVCTRTLSYAWAPSWCSPTEPLCRISSHSRPAKEERHTGKRGRRLWNSQQAGTFSKRSKFMRRKQKHHLRSSPFLLE